VSLLTEPPLRGDDRAAKVPPTLCWNRILPLAAPRLAAREAFQSEPTPAQRSEALHCLEKIGGAGRMKPATTRRTAEPQKQRRERPLVGTDEETNEQNHRQGRRIEARRARRNHSSSSAAEVARAEAGRATTTSQSPFTKVC